MTYANHDMQQVQLKDVQDNFKQIFEDVLVSGGPVKILRDTGNAILVSDEIWCGVTETLNLVSISGVRESHALECVKILQTRRQIWIGKMGTSLMNNLTKLRAS